MNVKNGNNRNFEGFSANGNTGLNCIQVDDLEWSTANWPHKDAGASYSTNCCTNPTSGGTIAENQIISSGSIPSMLTNTSPATGYTGNLEYKWQKSTTSSSAGFGDIASSNSDTFSPGVLTTTTWYKRLARVDCEADWTGAVESNVLTITVNNNSNVNQDIAMINGWNIISTYAIPSNLDLQAIFQTLIDAGTMKKVMDESGKTIENFGIFGGWKNNIGDLNSSKGYKVNVTGASTLSVEGLPVPLPMNISLSAGWNIISYPCTSPQDAKALVQPLIDGGKLIKVMDEAGKTIENFGIFGGWQNSIGNFLPGKGYKVNVTVACTLRITESANKSAVIVPEVLASSHFSKVYSGNGTDHFNVHLVNLRSSGLVAGDQIGIFDGNFCVGAATIGTDQLLSGSISIPSSSNDEVVTGKFNGFTAGHQVTLQLYRDNKTYPLTPAVTSGNQAFEKNGALFVKVTANDLPVAKINVGADQVKFYPNPFTDRLTIEISLTEPKNLEVNIYDLSGKLVRNLFNRTAGTSETLFWDGTNGQGTKVNSGIYLLKTNEMIGKIALKK